MLAEDVDDSLAAGCSRQPRKAIEHRQIGFGRAVLLEALTPRDSETLNASRRCQQRVDDRSLADARLAGHEDDLPLSSDRLFEPAPHACQLPVAPEYQFDGTRRGTRQGWRPWVDDCIGV